MFAGHLKVMEMVACVANVSGGKRSSLLTASTNMSSTPSMRFNKTMCVIMIKLANLWEPLVILRSDDTLYNL